MKNQMFQGTPTSPRFALCPSTVRAGDAVLIGTEPAVAVDDYQANEGGTTFYFNGSFFLPVVASSSHSPYTPAGIKPGAALYASGTPHVQTDGPTVTTDLFISVTTTDTPFGVLDPSYVPIAAGETDTYAGVRI
jgi:predicted RecA/RadA family phage recombinase